MNLHLPIIILWWGLATRFILVAGFSSTTRSTGATSPTATTTTGTSSVLRAQCRDGSLEVSRPQGTYNLAYKIYRPMTLSSRQACPLLVLHGGPSVPSDYLLPLVNTVPYRSIIFYDQLGCGRSDEPTDVNAYVQPRICNSSKLSKLATSCGVSVPSNKAHWFFRPNTL